METLHRFVTLILLVLVAGLGVVSAKLKHDLERERDARAWIEERLRIQASDFHKRLRDQYIEPEVIQVFQAEIQELQNRVTKIEDEHGSP